MGIDLPGDLCACVVRDEERPGWAPLEVDAYAALSVPLHEEGPPVVREWGKRVAIRLVFGLEELREKALCRIHGLDDRIVETVKITSSQLDWRAGPTLDAVARGERLSFRLPDADRVVEVPWSEYASADGQRQALAAELPGLFAERLGPLPTCADAARRRIDDAARGAANQRKPPRVKPRQ